MSNETDELPMTKQEAIEAFGSLKHLADALGIWPTAIYQWGERVPRNRHRQIVALLAENGAGR